MANNSEDSDTRKRRSSDAGVKSDFIMKELNRISQKTKLPPTPPSSSSISMPDLVAKTPLKYPWYIIFILGNELCERFAFYGMKTVLTLYFLEVFFWSEGTSTLVYHSFLVLSYFTPILGAMLADGYIGKFSTIFYLSVVYVAGLALMTLSSVPPIGLDPISGFLCGLLLVAVGTGGIKPCVVAYGADQFLEGQERQREQYFSIFYFCINAGSLVSTFVTPILRSDLPCLGNDGCYPAAYGVPAGLLAIAIVLFVLGRPFYRDVAPTGNVLGKVIMAVSHAIANKIRKRPPPGAKPKHWLDYAADTYPKGLLQDIKQILPVLKLFLPLPIFWTLFDQKGSRWTLQANKMDGRITDDFTWKPDQVQIFNPVLVLILVPIFEAFIYPTLDRFGIKFRLLARMVTGMVFAAIAFIIAGIIQMQLQATLPVFPAHGTAELRVFNTLPCDMSVTFSGVPDVPDNMKPVSKYGMVEFPVEGFHGKIPANDYNFDLKFEITNPVECGLLASETRPALQKIHLTNLEIHSIYISHFEKRLQLKMVKEIKEEKPKKGTGFARFVVPFPLNTTSRGGELILLNNKVAVGKPGYRYSLNLNPTEAFDKNVAVMDVAVVAEQGKYELYLQDGTTATGYRRFGHQYEVKNGGLFTVLLKPEPETDAPWESYAIVKESSLNIFLQLPQYVAITIGEILFSVSGLAFAYSQSPTSMKAVLQAGWLMTVAVGNVIVILISGTQLVKDQATEFFIFAALTGAFALIFAFMTHFYTYVEKPATAGPVEDVKSLRRPSTKEELEEAINE